jgi:hypothetical protein
MLSEHPQMENAPAEIPASPTRSEHRSENSVSEQPVNEVVYEYRANFIPPSSTICEAAPSEDGSTANYSAFNSNPVENAVKQFNNIKVTHSVDELSRDFYYFDDFGMKPMVIVVFETPNGDLISVNDIVMPLEEFLDVSHIKQASVTAPAKSEGGDLREIMCDSGRYGTVNCKTNDAKEFTVPNSNVKLVMMALSILSEEYHDDRYSESSDDTDEYESEEEEEPAVKQEEQLGLIRRLVRWLW